VTCSGEKCKGFSKVVKNTNDFLNWWKMQRFSSGEKCKDFSKWW